MADDLRTDAEALYVALNRLVRHYQFRDRDRICCHGISVSQCYALESLATDGPLRLSGLAERLMLENSTASRVVDSLVRKELATRVEDPEDRRAVRIALTEEGRALHARIHEDLVAEEEARIMDLTPAERRGAIKLLERLTSTATGSRAVACGTVEKGSSPASAMEE